MEVRKKIKKQEKKNKNSSMLDREKKNYIARKTFQEGIFDSKGTD